MHAHVWKPEKLRLYLEQGVTGIRDAGGRLLVQQRWRRDIESGTMQGPRMFMCGPILDGLRGIGHSIVVENESDAVAAVRGLALAKVDFVKVHDGLSREAFFAIASEAQHRHLRFAGHVPDAVSAADASGAGMRSIEHLDGVVEDLALFTTFVENDTWHVPTLVAKQDVRSLQIVGAMQRAGVRIMAGTDDVATLHEELKLLVTAGLTPMEALRAATSNPAEFLERADLGTIAPGALADLVLLSADPTIDIANSRRVSATIAAGRLYDPAAR
jgi:imidazolonepropionase-like amidohydrolase